MYLRITNYFEFENTYHQETIKNFHWHEFTTEICG